MNLNEYQDLRAVYTVYKKQHFADGLVYSVLALCGESGELANKLKKHLRKGTEPDREMLADELGDCLWYVAAVAAELGISLEEVAQMNLRKLAARKAADKITG